MTFLTHTDPTRKIDRFYIMQVMPSLFGDWTVLREWGPQPATQRREAGRRRRLTSALLGPPPPLRFLVFSVVQHRGKSVRIRGENGVRVSPTRNPAARGGPATQSVSTPPSEGLPLGAFKIGDLSLSIFRFRLGRVAAPHV
jgi:hypothetical protein